MTEQPSIIIALLCCPHSYCDGAVKVHTDMPQVEEPEDILARAAERAKNTNVSLRESQRRLHRYIWLRRTLL